MNETVITDWIGNMAFKSVIDDHTILMDSDLEYGGTNKGPRPKPLVLASLAGCTGMDIISILAKKRVFPTRFRIIIDGEKAETHPKYYRKIHLTYEFTGENYKNNPEILAKIERSIQLSYEVYCAVAMMLKNSSEITHSVVLLDK